VRRMSQCSIAVAALVVCGLAESAAAYYSPRLGRFISRDPIGEQGGNNLYCYTQNSPPARYDPLGQADQPNPGPPGGSWSRKLDWGPKLLNDKFASYDIGITHVSPQAPAGARQVWQVARCALGVLRKDCRLHMQLSQMIDIRDIGDREMNDQIGLAIEWNDVCVAFEVRSITIGFDDGVNWYVTRNSSDVESIEFGDRLLRGMRLPASYATVYGFLKKNCCSCVRDLLAWASVPDGEWLAVEGVGSWRSR
jgi:hypothetical protein